jgi:peptide/nickel transport system permease protein
MKNRAKSASETATIDPNGMSTDGNVAVESLDALAEKAPSSEKPVAPVSRTAEMGAFREMFYFAIRNRKLVVGFGIVMFFLLVAIVGPYLATRDPSNDLGGLTGGISGAHAPTLWKNYWFGTTVLGQDVFAQFVTGVRLAFEVGLIGGGIAATVGMLVGFTAGYKGGIIDELLNSVTNVVLCLPVFALLLVIAAFMQMNGVVPESIIIGCVTWPWAARALRAQTFSLSSREFVSLARLSGESSMKIIFKEIAPNVSSYLFMMFILLFGGAILTAATLDFLGLGPAGVYSLGMMMLNAQQQSALLLGYWWWFVPPGIAIMLIVGGAYLMNVGLDEVFNPRLREM